MAVGRYAANFPLPIAERWNGSEWSIVSVPSPTATDPNVKANATLNGVSCTSATSCIAVGQYVTAQEAPKVALATEERTLVERWDGTEWTIQSSPNRSGSKVSRLTGVSCTAATSCTAVGNSRLTTGLQSTAETLAMGWTGASWVIQSTPNVSESAESVLEDVSCIPNQCVAVGNAYTKNGTLPGFVLSNGSHPWSLVASRLSDPLYGVSCTPYSSCDAVGADSASKLQGEHWNGASLSPEELVSPYLGTQVRIGDISCAAKNRCIAVGSASERHGPVPLAERLMPAVTLARSVGVEGSMGPPQGAAADPAGNVWATEQFGVVKFNAKGEYLSRFGSAGPGNGEFSQATGIAVTAAGDLWVVDSGRSRVQKFNAKGEYLSQFGASGSGNGQFSSPRYIAIDTGGNLWVSDSGNHRVQEFTSTGTYIRSVKGGAGNGPELQYPYGVAIDGGGHLWVADRAGNAVLEYTATGTYMGQFGSKGAGLGQLTSPAAIAIKSSGDLLVTDGTGSLETGRVQEFSPAGEFVTQFGAGELSQPNGIALAPDGGMWIPDTPGLESRLEKWAELSAPTVSGAEVSGVTSTQAKVSATANPGGLPATYQFEYGTISPTGTSVPVPGEAIGSGFDDVKVSQTLTGLSPGTTYHFRVAATNPEGSSYGPEGMFHTPWNGAPRFEADQYPATVSGEQTAAPEFKFQTGTAKCIGVTTTGSLPAASGALTLTPAYTGCKAFGAKATIVPNSCQYVFHVDNAGPPYSGKLDVVCSKEGDSIKITPEAGICSVTIPPQSALGTIAYGGVSSGSAPGVSATISITGLKYTEASVSCAAPGTHTDGTLSGGAVLRGTTPFELPSGLYVTGLGS
jgi:sugar lactone lactonase YvrE